MMSLSRREAALQPETDASLAKQAAVSKKQAALREAAAAEEQQKIADEALEHQAEDRGRDSCQGGDNRRVEKPG